MVMDNEHGYKSYYGMYRGKVISNTDSDQLGRIKVEIYPMFTGITTASDLPYAVPAMNIFEGAGDGVGNFNVPQVDSFVFCFFEAGDVTQPVYFAEAQTATKGLPASRTTNYPYRKVTMSNCGIETIVDNTDKLVRVNHPTGSYTEIDTTGNIKAYSVLNATVQAGNDIFINAADHIYVTALGMTMNITGNCVTTINGDLEVTATGDIDMTGATVNINP